MACSPVSSVPGAVWAVVAGEISDNLHTCYLKDIAMSDRTYSVPQG